MQDIVTKENWSSDPNNAPLPSDFNRIESNTRKVEENRQEETTARENADNTLQNNIDSETAARIADVNAEEARAIAAENAINADLGGLDFVNGNAGSYGSKDIAQNERWVIPKGTYVFAAYYIQGIVFQIYTGSGWVGFGNLVSGTAATVPLSMTSDGVNFAFTGLNVSNPGTIYYRKLA